MIDETDSEVSYNDSLDEEYDENDPGLNFDPKLDSDSNDDQVVDYQVNVVVYRVENYHCSDDDDVNQDFDVDDGHHFDVVVHRTEHDDDEL